MDLILFALINVLLKKGFSVNACPFELSSTWPNKTVWMQKAKMDTNNFTLQKKKKWCHEMKKDGNSYEESHKSGEKLILLNDYFFNYLKI